MGSRLENILTDAKKIGAGIVAAVSGSVFGALGYGAGDSIGNGIQTTRQYNSCAVTSDGGVICTHHIMQTLPNLPYGEMIGAAGLALGVLFGAGMVYDIYRLRTHGVEMVPVKNSKYRH